MLVLNCCSSRDTSVDKSKLLGSDYRLFQNTIAWNLAKAVQDGDIDKIKNEIRRNKQLLKYAEPRLGHTLLQMAVMNRNYESVKILLALGASPNQQDTYLGNSALMESVKIGGGGILHPDADTSYLKILLKYGG
ncbi:MAG TPA: hypothetical protein VHC47_01155, partial [Mucilaginibacter sp.]|nr:hypothetical protein [Mucilaginibacter sp.]